MQTRTRTIHERIGSSEVRMNTIIATNGVYYEVVDEHGATIWSRTIPISHGSKTNQHARRMAAREQENVAHRYVRQHGLAY